MNKLPPLAVVDGVRTPMAKAFTDLQNVDAVQLGRVVVEDVLRRGGLVPHDVDEVIFGNVAGPADSANIARVIALRAGIPRDRIAHTVNRNCASGMESVIAAWQAIATGRSNIVAAGGTESMSNIPMLFRPSAARRWMRLGRARSLSAKLRALMDFRPKHFQPLVGIELGLTDPVCGLNMGQTAEVLAKEFGISRKQQDEFAMQSHQRAEETQKACFLSGEITPVRIPDVMDKDFEKDNAIRYGQSMEQLAKLRPIFDRNGTVTAGNSCPLTDGAACLLLSSEESMDRFSGPPLGYITDYAIAGCDPKRMGLGPVYAINKLLARTGRSINDFDLVEINEAFAAQVLACQAALGSKTFAQNELDRSEAIGQIDPSRLNVHGGAIALGHPVGMTGTRLILTLLRSLKKAGYRRGLATLCVGGGQGFAMILETDLGDKS
ncbi:thiolase family protein [Neorhodopirellula pilleata]|uniref:Acetyl-CoA acetyltransferase n=1 Tax=Neorhodopirellula pilleata TaxID=2714738 RepID=A0A5C5ZQI1_9BACT|nr:thiolase family protein [Neorhodopirellula pilleata]TWT89207.1 Acetyl-CoA acetyltransferase [Neorhodopirellula pilleata]